MRKRMKGKKCKGKEVPVEKKRRAKMKKWQ